MERWFLRGAAFGVGLWLVYLLATDPASVVVPFLFTVAVLGVARFIARGSVPKSS